MREIKFRLWDKEFNKMRVTGMGVNKGVLSCDDDCVIMQYTGLKDRTGRDIYEKDLLLIPSGYGGDFFYKQVIAEVKYDAPEFYPYNLSHKEGLVFQDFQWEDCEVIGNIYENPELLEAK
jgi:uncharacterized phage protein (TIGR01671 family)